MAMSATAMKMLNDVCTLIVDCEHKTAPLADTGYPSIRTPNIGKGRLLLDGVNLVSEETYAAWTKRAVPQSGDLILAREAPVGNIAIIPDGMKVCLGQRTVLIRPDLKQVSGRYIMYLLLEDSTRHKLLSRSNGATVRHLNMKAIRNLELPDLPKISVQNRIASILSNYDDLIDNNNRRIALLEESVHRLYREWFVHLRFPGHERVTVRDGVPEGWEPTDLTSIMTIKHGYAFKGKFFSKETTPRILLTPGNFRIGGGIKLEKVKYYLEQGPIDEEFLLSKNDLLVTMTDLSKASDTLGYPLLVPELNKMLFLHNQRLGKVLPKKDKPFYRYFLHEMFKDFRYRSYVKGSSSGTTVKHTSPRKILSYRPILPPYKESTLLSKFDQIAEKFNTQCQNLLQTNQALAKARDRLLPRLMNGTLTP